MSDTSIRRIEIAEQAEQAARRFVETGEPELNPHEGTENAQVWRSLFERWLLALTAPETEGSC